MWWGKWWPFSWAAGWFIIYCSVPRSRVWGALSSLGQGSTCWTHWAPSWCRNAAHLIMQWICFLERLQDCDALAFLRFALSLQCRRWARVIMSTRVFFPSRKIWHRGTHQLQGWSRRCSPNMADRSLVLCRRNLLFSVDLGVPSRPTRQTPPPRPTYITTTRTGTAMACLRAPGRWTRSLRPCVWRDYRRRPCTMRSNPSLWLGAPNVQLWRRTHLFCLTLKTERPLRRFPARPHPRLSPVTTARQQMGRGSEMQVSDAAFYLHSGRSMEKCRWMEMLDHLGGLSWTSPIWQKKKKKEVR